MRLHKHLLNHSLNQLSSDFSDLVHPARAVVELHPTRVPRDVPAAHPPPAFSSGRATASRLTAQTWAAASPPAPP
jgi:hypothetical protein